MIFSYLNSLGTFALGTITLIITLLLSIIFLSIKRFAEKLAELSAADFYQARVRK